MSTKTLKISYDLMAPGKDYEKLIKYLKSFNGYSHALKSMWFVRTSKSVTTVRDEIKAYTDSNDKVVVVDVTNDNWAVSGLTKSTLDWLHGYMSSSSARRAA